MNAFLKRENEKAMKALCRGLRMVNCPSRPEMLNAEVCIWVHELVEAAWTEKDEPDWNKFAFIVPMDGSFIRILFGNYVFDGGVELDRIEMREEMKLRKVKRKLNEVEVSAVESGTSIVQRKFAEAEASGRVIDVE